jgi:putative transposase
LKRIAEDLQKDYKVSVQKACSVIMLYRSAWYYQHHRREDRPVRERIKEIASTRVRYGYNRIYILWTLCKMRSENYILM